MEKPKKTLSGPVAVTSTLLLFAVAARYFYRMTYWWDHSNPVFAIWYGTAGGLFAFCAVGLAVSLFTSKDGVIGRLYSQNSPFLPIAVGLSLSIAGGYGMLVLVNAENVVIDWAFFGALLGTGLYVLKRTFSVEE